MEEIIYSQNNNSTISCYSMDFSGNSKQNAHSGRNVMPRCLSEGVDIFLKSVERQGESGHDVRVSRSAPWMARVGDPVMMKTTVSLFIRKFTPGDATLRRDVPFAMGVRGFFTNSQFIYLIYRPFSLPDGNLRRWSGSSVSRTSRCRSK